MIDTGLSGKVTLVTGANHGIGAATAKAFAAQGARVFVHYLQLPAPSYIDEMGRDEPGEAQYRLCQATTAEAVVAEIRALGGKVDVWEADLGDVENIPALFDPGGAGVGRGGVPVNNAAQCQPGRFLPAAAAARAYFPQPLPTVTPDLHDRHFAINSRAPALMMAEFGRRHIARGGTWGRIINVSTDAAATFANEVSYGASKYALESFSRSAAQELGRYGITVNILSPGPIQTGYIEPKAEESLIWRIPLGRLGTPEDVADVTVFLASEQARWVTGQLLYAGGGHRMG